MKISIFQCSNSTAWVGLGIWNESETFVAALPQSKGNKDLNVTRGTV